MTPKATKVLKTVFNGDMYECFLTEDDRIETVVVFYSDRRVGNVIQFTECPWPVRHRFEDEMDPHTR